MFYQLLYGTYPFIAAEVLKQVRPRNELIFHSSVQTISQKSQDLLTAMLDFDPDRRPNIDACLKLLSESSGAPNLSSQLPAKHQPSSEEQIDEYTERKIIKSQLGFPISPIKQSGKKIVIP